MHINTRDTLTHGELPPTQRPAPSQRAALSSDAAAVHWWDARFSAFGERIPFKSLFFPLLLQSCDAEQQQAPHELLSQDELAAITKHCMSESAWKHGFVTKLDFVHFVARFGPIEVSITKVVSCFCSNNELVPWFHGLLSRAAADRALAAASMPHTSSDGSFLVRFSESHPHKFTLSYVKIHHPSGRRELKNCLLENLGGCTSGYALSDSRTRVFASIQAFVQRSAARLTYGVPSAVAAHCNAELADIRALQNAQSNAYTTFSADTFERSTPTASPTRSPSVTAARGHALLFAQSPPQTPPGKGSGTSSDSTSSRNDCHSDSYGGFAFDALGPALAVTTKPVGQVSSSSSSDNRDDVYSDAGLFFAADKDVGAATVVRAVGNNSSSSPFLAQDHARVHASADYGSFQSSALATTPPRTTFMQQQQHANTGSRSTGDTNLPVQHAANADDAYGTFESFTSARVIDASAGAKCDRITPTSALSTANLSASASSITSTATSIVSSSSFRSTNDDLYGSFASLAVSMPPSNASFTSISSSTDTSNDAYGSFASLIDEQRDSSSVSGHLDGTSLQSLSPLRRDMPTTPTATPLRPLRAASYNSSNDADVYGSFASLASPPMSSIATPQHTPSLPPLSPMVLGDNGNTRSGPAQAPPPQPLFAFETSKHKEAAIRAQAIDDAFDSSDPATTTISQELAPQEQEQPAAGVHTHSAACSALEELNAGMACYQQKRLDEALVRFIHAQEVARATNDQVVEARALGNLGTVYLDKQNAPQAVLCYQQCLDITRSIKDTKRERTILNNLVLALMASEEYDRALALCEIQLEMTTNEINRQKIYRRMSLLREKAARAHRERLNNASAGKRAPHAGVA